MYDFLYIDDYGSLCGKLRVEDLPRLLQRVVNGGRRWPTGSVCGRARARTGSNLAGCQSAEHKKKKTRLII